MTRRTRTVIIVVAAVVAIPVVAYVGLIANLFIVPGVDAYFKTADFDSAAWKARALDGDPKWPTRLRMADDLVAGKRLSGLTRSQVEDLLGPPDDTGYFKEWSMVYWLGPERGFVGIDSEWLVVRVNEKGVVEEFRLVRD